MFEGYPPSQLATGNTEVVVRTMTYYPHLNAPCKPAISEELFPPAQYAFCPRQPRSKSD
jgi:hypothetical protein